MRIRKIQNEVKYNWVWTTAVGIFLTAAGIAVIGIPVLVTIGISSLMGLAFVASGLVQLIHTVQFIKSHHWASHFLSACLSIVAGVLTLKTPTMGAAGITLIMVFYLLSGSVARGTFAFRTKKVAGRGWLILSSVVSFCLGIYLLLNFPESSLIIPGTMLGIDLVFYGISLIFISASLPRGDLLLEATEFRNVA